MTPIFHAPGAPGVLEIAGENLHHVTSVTVDGLPVPFANSDPFGNSALAFISPDAFDHVRISLIAATGATCAYYVHLNRMKQDAAMHPACTVEDSPASFGVSHEVESPSKAALGISRTYSQSPIVSFLSPNTGPATGGTAFTLVGSELTGASVTFNGVAATSIVVNGGGTSLTGTAPAG
ncbi:IPT/TIG domain-containing protein, partial [Streptomyces kronopolitis]